MASQTVNKAFLTQAEPVARDPPAMDSVAGVCWGLHPLGHGSLFDLPASPIYSPASYASSESDAMDLEIDAAFLDFDSEPLQNDLLDSDIGLDDGVNTLESDKTFLEMLDHEDWIKTQDFSLPSLVSRKALDQSFCSYQSDKTPVSQWLNRQEHGSDVTLWSQEYSSDPLPQWSPRQEQSSQECYKRSPLQESSQDLHKWSPRQEHILSQTPHHVMQLLVDFQNDGFGTPNRTFEICNGLI